MSKLLHNAPFIGLIGLAMLAGCSKRPSQDTGGGESHVVNNFINPGFESGKLSPWMAYGDPQATVELGGGHSGDSRLAEKGTDGSVWQDISGLQTGKEYTISAWVSASEGSTATACLATYNPATGESTNSQQWKPTQTWQRVTYSLPLSKGDTLRIHLCRKPGTGTIYWDDTELTYK